MIRIASVGHAVFAATLIALGILGLLLRGHFAPIWRPVPLDFPARAGLAWLCGMVALGCGIGLLWPRTAAVSARVLLVYLLLWLVAFKLSVIVRAPAVVVSYESAGETAVLVAGAWVLHAWFAGGRGRELRAGRATGYSGVRGARLLYALALIAFGLSHFAYLELTTTLVPGWLPFPVFWACLTGAAYLVAGAALLIGVHARLAAALAAVQMGVFTLLVWAPMVISGHADASRWGEFTVSWTLTAAAWVVADSYRGTPWLSARRPQQPDPGQP